MSSLNPGPSLLYTFIILFCISEDTKIAAYTAKFPPFECPPILIFLSGYFFAIFSKYSLAEICDAVWLLKLILRSSFHPINVLSVPLYDIYIVSSGKIIETAENCFCILLSIIFMYSSAISSPNL